MDKVVRNGSVAVLYSPGYGAGWSTWNFVPNLVFDPDVVAWVEGGKVGPFPDLQAKYGDEYICTSGTPELKIEWVPVGTKFRIDEYDGFESVIVFDDQQWYVA